MHIKLQRPGKGLAAGGDAMRRIDRRYFYDRVRADLFGGRLSGAQVRGMEAMLAHWEETSSGKDGRWLAYMLATAFHETARTMQPVRETLAESDGAAIAMLDRAFARGDLPWVSEPYWRPDEDGKSWLGRGLVQLTHKDNYIRLGKLLGIELTADPARAMRMDVALKIMFVGMEQGSFTGHRLGQYFADGRQDWLKARQIINRMDRAQQVADYGQAFFAALGGEPGRSGQ